MLCPIQFHIYTCTYETERKGNSIKANSIDHMWFAYTNSLRRQRRRRRRQNVWNNSQFVVALFSQKINSDDFPFSICGVVKSTRYSSTADASHSGSFRAKSLKAGILEISIVLANITQQLFIACGSNRDVQWTHNNGNQVEERERKKKIIPIEKSSTKRNWRNKNYITNARADGALADTSKRAVVVMCIEEKGM